MMRTTVTLDADSEQILRTRMRQRRVSFKRALNDAVRESAGAGSPQPFRTRTVAMGESQVNLDRALQMAADLEDDELLRKLRTGR